MPNTPLMNQQKWTYTGLVILLAGLLAIAGCVGSEERAKDGDTVKVHYTGTLSDGNTFDTSVGGEPLEFTIGTRQVIVGFNKAVVGMAIGEEKTVTIPSAEAYGAHNDEYVISIQRDIFPDELAKVGTWVQVPLESGTSAHGIVTYVNETSVSLDLNHHLAGEDLTFRIKLLEIK